ncbi:DUF2283 domain-containing protein [Candidatus Daviesbacteria bacterium]|nr:DUF2283 domain-containing protein [Candidatus Daviesbacteria bacterium]
MKISYDKKIDAMYIYLTSKRKQITETKELDDGWIADYAGEELVGIEILDASKVLGAKLGFKPSRYPSAIAHTIKVKK